MGWEVELEKGTVEVVGIDNTYASPGLWILAGGISGRHGGGDWTTKGREEKGQLGKREVGMTHMN